MNEIVATYATTYPQLMNEILEASWGYADIETATRAYDIAERMTGGTIRPSGAGFLNHLIRTSSIALHEVGDPATVIAGLLHATYSLGGFGGLRARLFRSARRQSLSSRVGERVETIVFCYDALAWNTAALIAAHADLYSEYEQPKREALTLRICNELEDVLDCAPCFATAQSMEKRLPQAMATAQLAREIGLDNLGDQIQTAATRANEHALPEFVRTNRRLAYRPIFKALPEFYTVRRRLRDQAKRRRNAEALSADRHTKRGD